MGEQSPAPTRCNDIVTLVRISFRIFTAVGVLAFGKFSVEQSGINGMSLWENWIQKATDYEKCVEEGVP